MAALKAVVLAGPDPAVDNIARWRIVDLRQWVKERWDVSYSETGMLRLLWSLDLSHRKTRPRHPQSSEKAQQAFKRGVAARLTEIAQAHPEAERFDTGEIVDTCCDAWNWLLRQTGRIRSLCSYPWLERVTN